jgi:hypothetical protein
MSTIVPVYYLTLDSATPECAALAERYPGVRFNKVILSFDERGAKILGKSVGHWVTRPDADDPLFINFCVSGAARDLLRHGFAHRSWLKFRKGSRTQFGTPGFGYACSVTRIKPHWYRINGSGYDDGLDRLAMVLFPQFWAGFLERRRTVPKGAA